MKKKNMKVKVLLCWFLLIFAAHAMAQESIEPYYTSGAAEVKSITMGCQSDEIVDACLMEQEDCKPHAACGEVDAGFNEFENQQFDAAGVDYTREYFLCIAGIVSYSMFVCIQSKIYCSLGFTDYCNEEKYCLYKSSMLLWGCLFYAYRDYLIPFLFDHEEQLISNLEKDAG